jgi:DNA-binding NarL/FixJ family response regulator
MAERDAAPLFDLVQPDLFSANGGQANAWADVDNDGDLDEFVGAVERVAAGGSALDPIIVSTLLSRQRSEDPLAELTPREREVLTLMAEGRSNQGIADKLVITLRAVEKYVSTIFGKLGLPSTGSDSRRVLAVLAWIKG